MTDGTRTSLVLLVGSLGLAGCGDSDTSAIPTQPAPVAQVVQPTPQPSGIQLAGTVSDSAWRYLAGARVEVVDGAHAGLSTMTDASGQFLLTGAFDETTHFRATKEGHGSATFPLPASCAPCNPHWWIHFNLETLGPRADLTGNYTLSFIADGACPGLPAELRTRTYDAKIDLLSNPQSPANSRFNVTVTRPLPYREYHSFPIGLSGGYLGGFIGDLHGTPGIAEQIAPRTYYGIGGTIEASIDTSAVSTISAAVDGVIDYCELKAEMGSRFECNPAEALTRAQCTSKNHRLVLTRR